MSRVRLTASIVHDRSVPCLTAGCADIERAFARWLAAHIEATQDDLPPEFRESADALVDLIETALGDRHARAVRETLASAPRPAACCAGEAHRAAVAAMVAGARR